VNYTAVKNAHIVPRTYLLSFAEAGKIAMRLRGEQTTRVMAVEKVATRNRYYRRTRPTTGQSIDDVEWSLSVLEEKIAPVIRALVVERRWPLPPLEKAQLAELFAVQMLRGPSWQGWAERAVEDAHARGAPDGPLDTARLTLMLQLSRPLTTLLGSMQWLLVAFHSPLLATSDEPVVIWPYPARSRSATDPPPAFEFQHLLEVRVPVSPHLAIVMTWADAGDAAAEGRREDAANLNAFTVGQADRQWFHLPSATAPIASGRLLPLSPHFLPGYGPVAVAASQRRDQASKYAIEGLGRPLGDPDVWLVDVNE
jgi:hypothetical protein